MIYERNLNAGGSLRSSAYENKIADSTLEIELKHIGAVGIEIKYGISPGHDIPLGDLIENYDAVLLATGSLDSGDALGVESAGGFIRVDGKSQETSVPSVFAAGDAVRSNKWVVRTIVSGKNAAVCIDQFLKGQAVSGYGKPYSTRASRLGDEELGELAKGVGSAPRASTIASLSPEEVQAQASRCLHCDCGKQDDCVLRKYAEIYGASVNRFKGPRRELTRSLGNADIIFESGKCILCGTCVRISGGSSEPLGLTFCGRGFDACIDVPFGRPLSQGLVATAVKCAESCPTGAIVVRGNDNADLGGD